MSPQVGRYLLANSIGRQVSVRMPFRCRAGPWRRLEYLGGGGRSGSGRGRAFGGKRCNELHLFEALRKKAWKPRFCWVRMRSHRNT